MSTSAGDHLGGALEVLAVIPARGGSKGIPGKNLIRIGDRTLVGHAAAAAHAATCVTRVVGSTDDAAIAEELLAAGVEVVERPAELAGDDVTDPPVFLHALDHLAAGGYEPDIVVNVRPTAPLRTGADIDAAVSLLTGAPWARSVKSVSVADQHPYKMWTLTDDGRLVPLLPKWHEAHGGDPDLPRQRLPAVYRSNGAVDATWTRTLRETSIFHPGPVVAYVMEPERALDVDTIDDVEAARRWMEAMEERS